MVRFRQCIDAGLVEQRAYPFVNQPGGGKAVLNILLVNDPEYSSDSDVTSDSDNSGNEVYIDAPPRLPPSTFPYRTLGDKRRSRKRSKRKPKVSIEKCDDSPTAYSSILVDSPTVQQSVQTTSQSCDVGLVAQSSFSTVIPTISLTKVLADYCGSEPVALPSVFERFMNDTNEQSDDDERQLMATLPLADLYNVSIRVFLDKLSVTQHIITSSRSKRWAIAAMHNCDCKLMSRSSLSSDVLADLVWDSIIVPHPLSDLKYIPGELRTQITLHAPDISVAYVSAPVSEVSWVSSHELAVMSDGQTHHSHDPSYGLQAMVIEYSVDELAVMPERDTLDLHRVGDLQELLSDGRSRIVTDISTIEFILVSSQNESSTLPGNLNKQNQQRLLDYLSSGSQHLSTSGALYIANKNQLAELDCGPYHIMFDYTELVPLASGELDISDNSSRNSSDDVGANQQ